jgi:hypothetical protein
MGCIESTEERGGTLRDEMNLYGACVLDRCDIVEEWIRWTAYDGVDGSKNAVNAIYDTGTGELSTEVYGGPGDWEKTGTPVGTTVLIAAAVRGYPAIVKVLIAAGAHVNAKDSQAHTALYMSADNCKAILEAAGGSRTAMYHDSRQIVGTTLDENGEIYMCKDRLFPNSIANQLID